MSPNGISDRISGRVITSDRSRGRGILDAVSLNNDVRHWVWALSGGGAKGAFQFGAMLYLSHDVRLLPKGIASTSVGSINLVGAAEANMRGLEKLKRTWTEIQNLHDMYTISPWIKKVDSLPGMQRTIDSLQKLVEGSTARSIHPNPEPIGESLDRTLIRAINKIPTGLQIYGVAFLNLLTFGIFGSFMAHNLTGTLEELKSTLEDFRAANKIIREEADGIWRFDSLREKIKNNLDLDAIRQAGTHLRICMVSLNNGFAYSMDENLYMHIYKTDRKTDQYIRKKIDKLFESYDDNDSNIRDEKSLFVEAVLASASIPIINPPLKLRIESSSFPDYMVDGGLREVLPIDQAIDILENDLSSEGGKKGIISITAGVSDPERMDSNFTELISPPFKPEDYKFTEIGETSLSIATEEIMANELRVARYGLPEGVESLVIAPSFALGETSDIDPGVVQISIAYGWMTAFDKLKQKEVSETEYEQLKENTNLIAQMRYAVWKLEREGTSFYHEHKVIIESVPYWLLQNAGIDYRRERDEIEEGLLPAIRNQVPTGWVFKDQARVGLHMVSIIERIRERKNQIKLHITRRVEKWTLDSLPTTHDLSNFGVRNENCFADWYRYWERHSVHHDTNWPTGPGLIDPESGNVVVFGRFDSPWDAFHKFSISNETNSIPAWINTAWRNVSGRRTPSITGIPKHSDVFPNQVNFHEIPALSRELAWFERDPDYTIVRLEGYVFDPMYERAREGIDGLFLKKSSSGRDNYTTSRTDSLPDIYSYILHLGFIFSPRSDQPDGTIPLYTWYSRERMDHLTTSDYWRFIEGNPFSNGQWNPVDNIEPDYSPDRLEGYIFPPNKPQPEGTIPLYRWISFERKDNFTTTDPGWVPNPH